MYGEKWGDEFVFKLLDDLAGAIHELFKSLLKAIGYFFAGMLLVAVPCSCLFDFSVFSSDFSLDSK